MKRQPPISSINAGAPSIRVLPKRFPVLQVGAFRR
jgi:hypothetical protein